MTSATLQLSTWPAFTHANLTHDAAALQSLEIAYVVRAPCKATRRVTNLKDGRGCAQIDKLRTDAAPPKPPQNAFQWRMRLLDVGDYCLWGCECTRQRQRKSLH
eukprot:3529146-Pleurochrysis_carterae.AAC.2